MPLRIQGADPQRGAALPCSESPKQGTALQAATSRTWSGVLVILAVTASAFVLHYLPTPPFRVVQEAGVRRPISPEIIAIVLGVLLRNLFPLPAGVNPASRWVIRVVLPGTVVFIGAGLDLLDVRRIGLPALGVVVAAIVVSAVGAIVIGQWFRLPRRASLLIGAGTAICGNSAIVAVAPLIKADDRDLVLSLGTINLIGLVAMVLLPVFGGLLHWSDQAFGVLAGATVHSVPQAVAAGYAFSAMAGGVATLTKLVRVTLLTPLVIALALLHARSERGHNPSHMALGLNPVRMIPWYIWGFLATTVINTLHWFPVVPVPPDGWVAWWWGSGQIASAKLLAEIGKWLLTVSMVAIGLEVDLPALARVGGRALAVGSITALLAVAAAGGLILLLLPQGGND